MKKKTFYFLIIATALLSNFVFGVIPASERAALIALYNNTNGDGWTDNFRWKTPPLHTDGFAMPGTEDRWEGVTVSEDHVAYLLLDNNQLMGNIPSELGNLTNLQGLRLDSNHLSGSIPSELANLNNLLELNLSENSMRGSIPSQLGRLSQLKELILGSNQLSGGIPSEFGNLSNLETLYLDDNLLSGSIPSQLGNLGNLKKLSLCWNQLSGGIPSELGNLRSMEHLLLWQNRLGGEIPPNLQNLTNIIYITLAYNCLSASDSALRTWLSNHDWDWEATQNQCEGKTSNIGLNRSQLNFSTIIPGYIPNAQTVLVSNTGSGVLNWSASGNAAWLVVTPSSGTNDSVLLVSIDSTGLAVGSYTGAIIITDPEASNSPQPITVSLHVYDQGQTSAPFGEFATPLDGATVSGSIPVTGWALDDIGVANVKIYNGDAYIGDALFVEGARPDVEAAYPTYPNSDKAGWGYMLLTNCLPDGGNGTYTLTAKATDMEGNEVTLGSKTITIDNAHVVNPFGAIDIPIQGGTASGKKFINNGWVITPQPNMIPEDGSTIDVVIDGVVKGHPRYNVYRWDIAWFFPGYANTNGAAGYYLIDTTKLSNGVHTIAWTVSDSGGNSDGIGSRYFTIQNSGAGDQALGVRSQGAGIRRSEPAYSPIFDPYSPSFDEIITIEIKELQRVEINLSDEGLCEGYLVVGDQLRGLPIGSTLDTDRGIFYWQPGPGFVGEYRFVFIGKDDEEQYTKKTIVVNIKPMH